MNPIGEDWMEEETGKEKKNKSFQHLLNSRWNKDFGSGRLVAKCRRKRNINLILKAVGNH